jgi:PAS domain S-box-containing protein
MKNFQEKSLSCTKFLNNWFEEQNSSAAQLKLMFENIPGMSFFIKDRDHRLITVNESLLMRFGLDSKEDLIGKTDFDLFPPDLLSISGEKIASFLKPKNQDLTYWNFFLTTRGCPVGA